jgi:hypothetical protein
VEGARASKQRWNVGKILKNGQEEEKEKQKQREEELT